MYADDHGPPHFHIVGPDFQVLVRISDLGVIAGKARRAQIAKAVAWAAAHRKMLELKWAELNERGYCNYGETDAAADCRRCCWRSPSDFAPALARGWRELGGRVGSGSQVPRLHSA